MSSKIHLCKILLLITCFLNLASVSLQNETQRFHLRAKVKPGQPGKARFNNQYLKSCSCGYNVTDAVLFSKSRFDATDMWLNGTNARVGNTLYQNLVFDFGQDFPWTMAMQYDIDYNHAWNVIHAVKGPGGDVPGDNRGFYINGTGLEWSLLDTGGPNSFPDPFSGWLGMLLCITVNALVGTC